MSQYSLVFVAKAEEGNVFYCLDMNQEDASTGSTKDQERESGIKNKNIQPEIENLDKLASHSASVVGIDAHQVDEDEFVRKLPNPSVKSSQDVEGQENLIDSKISPNMTEFNGGEVCRIKIEQGFDPDPGAPVSEPECRNDKNSKASVKEISDLIKTESGEQPDNVFDVNSILNSNTESAIENSLQAEEEMESVSSPSTEADADFEDDVDSVSDIDEKMYEHLLQEFREDGTERIVNVDDEISDQTLANDKASQVGNDGILRTKRGRKKNRNKFHSRKNKLHGPRKSLKYKGPHVCHICGVVKHSFSTIRYHLNVFHGLKCKVFKCAETDCDYQTKYESTFRRHMEGHRYRAGELEKTLKCEVCEKLFLCPANLKTHMIIHSEVKPYNCEICNKGFAQKNNYKLHLARHVLRSENEKDYSHHFLDGIDLDTCDKVREKSAQRKPSTYTPQAQGSFKRELRFPCELCGKMFRWNHDMKRHVRTVHHGLKQFECKICGKKVVDKHALMVHINSNHEKIKNFQCVYCSRKYFIKNKLQEHVRRKHKMPVVKIEVETSPQDNL